MEVEIPEAGVVLQGDVEIPGGASGAVIFVHGSGSSRHSSRNVYVASFLNKKGFATLLFDLLTAEEEGDRENVFDITLLTQRLVDVTGWVKEYPGIVGLPVGYFGASTGAAAAIAGAVQMGGDVAAVVSRGGRVDMAEGFLERVTVPVLMIVGSEDDVVLDLNEQAQKRMRCVNALEIVPGATHLIEEPGALDVVAEKASEWFTKYLKK